MAKALGFDVELPVPFEAAVTQVKDVLKQEGFGVLIEIDLRAAFREKLGPSSDLTSFSAPAIRRLRSLRSRPTPRSVYCCHVTSLSNPPVRGARWCV